MQGTTEKVALITGPNKGIGFEVFRQLGRAGCTVLLGARNPSLGGDAASKLRSEKLNAQFIQLDVLRMETIQGAADFIASGFQRFRPDAGDPQADPNRPSSMKPKLQKK